MWAWLVAVGLLVVLLENLFLWQRDRHLVARLRKGRVPPPRLPEDGPLVSVLVAAWNEAEGISAHIESFLRLRYPNRELILCAGGDDGTLELARRYSGEQVVVLEQQPGEGKQGALRRSLERASGTIIFLTDADCLLDDEVFGRTLAPLLLEGEEVATGSYRPLDGQMDNPFVMHQWCADLVSGARMGEHANSILGRNCALRRETLAGIGGFDPPVRTGTDYYMGKKLVAGGYHICYLRDSEIQTRYQTALVSYWRKQSRWVRNLIVHGPRFGARAEIRAALRTSLVGLTMLLLPFVGIIAGPLPLVIWVLLFAHAFLARMRYAGFAHLYRGALIGWRQVLLTPLYLLADFVAWSRPMLDMLIRREAW